MILQIVLLALLGIACSIQLYYILFVHTALGKYKIENQRQHQYLPISVIICARNEEKNLKLYLSEILEQDYPSYEVVVVNDCSSDGSDWLLKEYQQRYPHLRIVSLEEHKKFKHGKKFAVTLGIKAAANEHLVFTDADCYPQSNQWLRHMAGGFAEGKDIVLGYSPYVKMKGFLNRYIRFETFQTALNYLSYALRRNPYMGVGRNLAYTKTLFFKAKGFASHMHIPSGDDDLFVNQNATAINTTICIDEETHLWSLPKTTLSTYRLQKRRHFGAGKAYKSRHKRMLSLQAISSVLFYVAIILILSLHLLYWPYALGAYLLRLLLQGVVYYPAMKKLQVKDLIWWWPILDVLHCFYIVTMGFLALFRKNVNWK